MKRALAYRPDKRYPVAACTAGVAVPQTIFTPGKSTGVCAPVHDASAATAALIHRNAQRLKEARHRHECRNFAGI